MNISIIVGCVNAYSLKMSYRSEFISIAVRGLIAAGLSFVTLKYALRYMDPNYGSRAEIKRKVAKLFAALGIDGDIELDDHEMRIATQFVGGEDIGADWEEIVECGCDELIAELKDRIILPLRLAADSKRALLSPPKGVLLYGPPGCGKTLLAKAVARAAGCRFLNLQISNLTDKWYGESQKLAAAVFSVAQKFQPTIIFIDEIDSFLRDRQSHDHEATAMMKAQFMTLWDGFVSTNDQIIIMGATNRPRDVDAAILRRLPAKFEVPVPNVDQRKKILKVILDSEQLLEGLGEADVDLEKVAMAAEGLSGSDLKEVCRIAVLARVKATLADCGSLDALQPMEQSDFDLAIAKFTRGATGMMADLVLD